MTMTSFGFGRTPGSLPTGLLGGMSLVGQTPRVVTGDCWRLLLRASGAGSSGPRHQGAKYLNGYLF